MKPNLASFGGMFTPLVNNGDFVALKQQIGTIRMARNLGQYANSSGEISDMLDPQQVHAGEVLCNIETDATNWQPATHTFLLRRLVPKRAKKVARKVIKKTTKRAPKKADKKAGKKSAPKSAKKTIRKIPKKSTRKSAKKIVRKVPKKSTRKSAKKTVRKIPNKSVKKAVKKKAGKK